MRVPCPLDPKHTCYTSKLEKHLQICNARQADFPIYIKHNINSANEANGKERKPLGEISKEDLLATIDKVNNLYDEIISNNILSIPPSPIHTVITEEFNEPDRGDKSRRHLRQASALLKVMQEEELVKDGHCYVELGAGKGHLSYYICMAWCSQNSSHSVLIDRAALRHKRDNKLRETKAEGRVLRIRADLAHVSLADVETVMDSQGVVGFAKHLCGVATDLALRCITEQRVLAKTRGVVLATCCHHRCQFDSYVGRTFLQDKGITPSDFNIMLGIVSWYTCGDGLSRNKRFSQENKKTHGQEKPNQQDNGNERQHDTEVNPNLEDANNIEINISNQHLLGQNYRNWGNNSVNEKTTDLLECNREHTENNSVEMERKSDANKQKESVENVKSTENSLVEKNAKSSKNNLEDSSKGREMNTENCFQNNDIDILMNRQYKEEVGRRAKVLIDWGRVQYLKSRGFDSQLCHFVPTSVSLENVCIVAKKMV